MSRSSNEDDAKKDDRQPIAAEGCAHEAARQPTAEAEGPEIPADDLSREVAVDKEPRGKEAGERGGPPTRPKNPKPPV